MMKPFSNVGDCMGRPPLAPVSQDPLPPTLILGEVVVPRNSQAAGALLVVLVQSEGMPLEKSSDQKVPDLFSPE